MADRDKKHADLFAGLHIFLGNDIDVDPDI